MFRRHHNNDKPVASMGVHEVPGHPPGPPPPINNSTRPQSNQDQKVFSGGSGDAGLRPRFLNISSGETVHQRLFLTHGGAGPANTQFDGSILIYHHLNSFPSQRFPVSDGIFKAIIHLEPGWNRVRFVYEGPGATGGQEVSSVLELNYVPLLQDPPVHFCIVLGKDSKGEFDSPKYKRDKEGNGLDLLVKKVRLAGYMMSCFTHEQMNRNGFGHRSFRLYEEFLPDTLSVRGKDCRTTAKIHIVRSEKTVAEIRDPNRAQQNPHGNDTGSLFGIALDALKAHGGPFDSGHPVHAAVIFADTHWDPQQKLVLGHAALGGGSGDIRLAIFGSHACHSWPSSIEEIVPAFMDDTRTDTTQVANDSNQSGTSWEACNIGQGAFMHEIGHLLGCPHQPYGVMLRDYITWNRSFMTREAFCARTNSPGLHLALPKDECGWHRLDALRFRFHPGFRNPDEEPVRQASKPNVYPVEMGSFARSDSGIYLVEIHVDGQCRGHLEFPDRPQTEVYLLESELRSHIPEKYRSSDKKIKLEILSVGEQQVTIEEFGQTSRTVVIPGLQSPGLLSNKLGGGSGDETVTLFPPGGQAQIRAIRVFAGRALDGIELFFFDGSSTLFGKQGGKPNDFPLEAGETLVGLMVRTGAWVDGAQIITSHRRSPVYGNSTGGGVHELIAPTGYQLAGLYGNIGVSTEGARCLRRLGRCPRPRCARFASGLDRVGPPKTRSSGSPTPDSSEARGAAGSGAEPQPPEAHSPRQKLTAPGMDHFHRDCVQSYKLDYLQKIYRLSIETASVGQFRAGAEFGRLALFEQDEEHGRGECRQPVPGDDVLEMGVAELHFRRLANRNSSTNENLGVHFATVVCQVLKCLDIYRLTSGTGSHVVNTHEVIVALLWLIRWCEKILGRFLSQHTLNSLLALNK
ncbi:putative metalloendopeptidase [Sugiyamaella lignohabitans]|uniref:Putative metalloendopeptidase n=1 Tax=Sugiyamaella lignohabitans TaxID=796027 RepID=A0A167D5K4_9ASCO|nr:putative metalloendopeptidase [Sugiyamaella lignohabitans]ANB12511.1 putative metalloendopeptidase [Sugiyamaella lignohabitans]